MDKEINQFSLIDYDHCITNLTSSIQAYYGLKPNYKTNSIADEYLAQKEYQNVIVMVFDAMGSKIIQKNTTVNHFLQKKMVSSMKSTYPPTTANCTTAYLSGKNPVETGWLGWSSYFAPIDQCIDNFINVDSLTKEPFLAFNVAEKFISYEELGKQIEKQNKDVTYYTFWPKFKENGCISLKQLENRLIHLCNQPGKKYIYVYWDEPDATMHETGTCNNHIKKILNDIAKLLRNFERKTKDSIAFVSADHGQLDVVEIPLYTYYDLYSCLKRVPSIDSRTPSFFVKEGRKDEFKEKFEQYFHDKFILLTHEEIMQSNIFGSGPKHPLFESMIGDFVAIAIRHYYFSYSPNGHHFLGHHAGLTNDELEIPLIILQN